MRDKDGFIIKCKYSDREIVDAQDNYDDVCLFYSYYHNLKCYADERCAHYVPDIAESGEDPKPIECEDVISRAEVKRIVDFYKEQYDGIYHINESIDNLPSVTQKSGKWITDEPTVLEPYVCSECGIFHNGKYKNFCPNCGAKMIEPQESEDKE